MGADANAAAPEMEPVNPGRLFSLDGLRGLAILLVIIHQLGMMEQAPGLGDYLFKYLMGTGWVGVQLFFVLSGFLITGILLDSVGSENYFRGFYLRRMLRIFPLYYGVLVVAFVILPLAGAVPSRVADSQPHQWMFWLFLSNWGSLFGADSGLFPHFWSLAVEEQFYLVWPLLMWRSTPRRALVVCGSVVLFALGFRAVMVAGGVPYQEIYEFTICRMDALAMGGAAAAALRIERWREQLLALPGRLLLASIVVALAGALLTHRYANYLASGEIWGYSFLAVSFSLLLLSAVASEIRGSGSLASWLRLPVLLSLGKYSFAIYVFHKPLHELFGRPLVMALGWPVNSSAAFNLIYIGMGLAALWLLALISYHLYEKHFLQLKDRLAPRTLVST